MNPQIVDDPEFQCKPAWAKAIWNYLWLKCDYAGFAVANWRVIQVICNVEEPKTDEEIWEALEGLVVKVEGTPLAYVENFIQTARAQGNRVSSSAAVHLKIYKDMKAMKQRFKVKDPMSYARRYNPDLKFDPLSASQESASKDGETGKETPRHLFDVLGIPDEGYVAWNKREEEASKSVSVSDDNKPLESSSYTQQDDGVEDIFKPVQQDEERCPDKHPDQSKPINRNYCQEAHQGYLDDGQYMTTEGFYRYPINNKPVEDDKEEEVIANF